MTPLEAKALCIRAHAGIFRKDGVTHYFTHPLAVAEMVEGDDEKVIAYLHDVVEDTKWTLARVNANEFYLVEEDGTHHPLNSVQYGGIKVITKEKGMSYEKYLTRFKFSIAAAKVKIADMFHNMSDAPSDKQKQKYLTGITALLKLI